MIIPALDFNSELQKINGADFFIFRSEERRVGKEC